MWEKKLLNLLKQVSWQTIGHTALELQPLKCDHANEIIYNLQYWWPELVMPTCMSHIWFTGETKIKGLVNNEIIDSKVKGPTECHKRQSLFNIHVCIHGQIWSHCQILVTESFEAIWSWKIINGHENGSSSADGHQKEVCNVLVSTSPVKK